MQVSKSKIVHDMCLTWRHDYGLTRMEHDGPGGLITAGMTDAERQLLYRHMAQIFDNDVRPILELSGVEILE